MLKSRKTKLFSYTDLNGKNQSVYSYIPSVALDVDKVKKRKRK
jgi:Zn/Cd-binding protein ZinT